MAESANKDTVFSKKKKDSFSKKWLLRSTALGTAVAMYMGGPYIDMATDSYELPPMTDCAEYSAEIEMERAGSPALQQQAMSEFLNDPASANTLIMQSILSKGGTEGRMNAMVRDTPSLDIQTEKSPNSADYKNSCDTRGDLIDIAIYNPLLKETPPVDGQGHEDDYLHFKAIANFDDPASGNKAVAYYQPDSGTLFIGTVGLTADENHDRAWAAISGNTERLVPYEFADKFIAELRDQLRDQGVKVSNTTIFSHSLGTPGGVLMKAKLEQSMANQVVFGKNPSLTIVEGFGESLAAEAVIEETGISSDKLTRNTVSVRSGGKGTANMIATEWHSNQTIGREVYSISSPDGTAAHELGNIVDGLVKGSRKVSPTDEKFTTVREEMLKGRGIEVLGKLAKAGREFRQTISASQERY